MTRTPDLMDRFERALARQGDAQLPPLLEALRRDKSGDWAGAHDIAQDIDSSDGSWLHAYLHRKEGDLPNASYWYRHAGRPVSQLSLDEEWAQLAEAFLNG